MKRATPSDLRDLVFETHMRQILGPRCGLAIAMLRRIGRERAIMTFIEGVAAEYADLLPGAERLDLDQDRPRLVVIEGTLDAGNDDDEPPSPGAAA